MLQARSALQNISQSQREALSGVCSSGVRLFRKDALYIAVADKMPVTEQHIETAREIARRHEAECLILFGRGQTEPGEARDLDIAIGGVEGWDIRKFAGRLERAPDIPLEESLEEGRSPVPRS